MDIAVATKQPIAPLVEVFTSEEADLHVEERESGGKKQLWLETIVQKADTRNRNGRIYPRSVLEREVRRFQAHIDAGTSYGEADHPKPGETPSVTRQAILWKKVGIDEHGVVRGSGIVMDTQAGKDVKAILAAGGAIGTSSRGRGTVSLKQVEGEGKQAEVVNEDYQMRTFDLVIDQSVHDAVSRMVRYEQHLIEQELRDSSNPQEKAMNLETLKKDHPAVYEAIMAEAKAAGASEIQTRLEAMLKEREASIRQAIIEEMTESGQILDEDGSERLIALEAFTAVMIEAAREAGLIDASALAEDEVAEELTQLREMVKKLKKQNAAMESALKAAQAKQEETDVEEAAREFAKDHALFTELTEALVGECDTMEVFESKKATIKGRYDKLAERMSEAAPAGSGTTLTERNNPEPGKPKGNEPGKSLTERQKVLRNMAGING